jgi:hypothetical protein
MAVLTADPDLASALRRASTPNAMQLDLGVAGVATCSRR